MNRFGLRLSHMKTNIAQIPETNVNQIMLPQLIVVPLVQAA